jgi:hypothetical protein
MKGHFSFSRVSAHLLLVRHFSIWFYKQYSGTL